MAPLARGADIHGVTTVRLERGGGLRERGSRAYVATLGVGGGELGHHETPEVVPGEAGGADQQGEDGEVAA